MDLLMLEDEYGSDIETGLIRPEKEDKLYVAVGKEFRENELNLIWAIQNSGGCKICILHVHQPHIFIPILGEKFHWSNLNEQQVKKYRGIEKQLMLKSLDEYLHFCHEFGVQAEKLYIEMDSVERGILQLIADHDIQKLVMGAATDGCYHAEMMEPMSKKAAYVQMLAPAKCHIWFICKGHLIHHRKCCLPVKTHAKNGAMILHSMEGESSKCVAKRENLLLGEGSSHFGTFNGRASVPCIDKIGTTRVPLPESDPEAYSHSGISEILQLFDSRGSSIDSLSLLNKRESAADQIEVQRGHVFEQNHHRQLSSPLIIAQEKVSELEVEAARRMEELEKLKIDRDKLREDLQCAMNQNSILESKVANYAEVMNELEEGIISNVELLQVREKECDDLKIERDNVLKNATELVTQSTEAATKNDALGSVATFTFTEIERATNDFDPSLQLWEGEDVSVYKGIISHTEVTIKIWRPEGSEFPQDLYREVEILSKFRHPNVVTLIGVCPEAYAVVYEHLPNGNLQKRLNSASNTLSWQTRIRIATELCCALIFLHSRVPERVIHGALKPASIFLDSNFTCKISEFGFSRIIPRHENSLRPGLHSSSYTDPQYVMTGLATPAADVYSFGIILMELLTGKSAETVMDELEDSMIDNSFYFLLDTSAGKWPFVQAEQLTRMALRCCDANASGRPDLESDVWRVLEPMRTSCGCSTSNNLGDEEHNQAPSYFICPIFQEVMKDPHIAADGYTYEAEAVRGWLDTGHDTSPMTNLQLQHTDLVPNHALRSAIREWSQRHQLSENA